jgi:hypothetical protein
VSADRAALGRLRYIAQDACSGYGEVADRLVRALRGSGTPVDYRGWHVGESGSDPGWCRHSRDPRPDSHAAPGAPTIAHEVPEQYPAMRAAILGVDPEPGPFIAHTVWETDRIQSHWPRLLNEADRVIVPTSWNAEVFQACGVTAPIAVVPHIVCDPVPGDGGIPLGYSPGTVVFYTISRWDQRKNLAAVVAAFLDAFTADDPVALVVKTSPCTEYPISKEWGWRSPLDGSTLLEVARIVRQHPHPADVRVDIAEWVPARIAGLHTRGDCYVSLSHGEGWDVGAFDACAYGNPVIAPHWGGPLAYLDPDAAFLVEADIEPVVHFGIDSHASDQNWARPRADHAVELLHEIATDVVAARRRAAPLRAHVLTTYAPGRVVETLREQVPELDLPRPAVRPLPRSRSRSVPRIAHFVFGLRPTPEPFHLVHYLAVRSCLDVVRPDEVHLHCPQPPAGPYWELLRGQVELRHVEPVPVVRDHEYTDPLINHYAYAHHADFVRLDILAQEGGLYADLDTLFLNPIPPDLWHEPCTIGREADVAVLGGPLRPSLSNAFLLAAPGSSFIDRWCDSIAAAFDGSWCAHSCFLAAALADQSPGEVHVEPQRTFHAFEPSPEGLALLFEHEISDLEGVVSLHLAAHLWWDTWRTDFSAAISSTILDEAWVRSTEVTYAKAARRFLPRT